MGTLHNYLSTSGVAYVTHIAEAKGDLGACFYKRLSCFMNAIRTEKRALASVYILTCYTVWPRNDAECMQVHAREPVVFDLSQ